MNLAEFLKLQRPLIIFDTETTGPNPHQDRVVEIGFSILKPDGSEREWSTFVNPEMDIPREATFGNAAKGYDGHGITDEMVRGCRHCGRPEGFCPVVIPGVTDDLPPGGHHFAPWPTFGDLAISLLRGFKECDYGGYSIKGFDLPLMSNEFRRVGHVWEYDDARILDGYRLWQIIDARNLGAAAERFLGRKHEGAHRVLADVRTSLEVLLAQLQQYPDLLPADLAQLHELQWPRDPNEVPGTKGQVVWREGVLTMNFGKNWRGKRLDLMSRRDLDWIAGPKCSGATDETKRICREALDGNFPTRSEPPAGQINLLPETT